MYRNITDERYYKLKKDAFCIIKKIRDGFYKVRTKKNPFNRNSAIKWGLQDLRTNSFYTNEEIRLVYINLLIYNDLEFFNNMIECNNNIYKIHEVYNNRDEIITREDIFYKMEEIRNFEHLMFDKNFPCMEEEKTLLK